MKNISRIILLLLILNLLSCQKKEIQIALMTKLDQGSIIGSSEFNSCKMFVNDHPHTKIKVTPFNDQWIPSETRKQFQIIKNQNIQYIISSHTSSCLVTIKDDINTNNVLTIITGAATDAITNLDDNIIRIIPDVQDEQKFIADYMNANFKKLLIVQDMSNASYTNPAIQHFMRFYKAYDYKLIRINIDSLNIDLIEKEIAQTSFDDLYLLIGAHKADAGIIAQLARKYKPACKIMYTPWMKTPSLLESAGNSLIGSFMPSYYPPRSQSKNVNSFLTEYKHKYGVFPASICLNIYSALEILDQAIQNGAENPKTIKDYIINHHKFKTRFKTIEFNQYGDNISNIYMITDIKKEFE